ncbi:MAG: arsenical efflux pump membrane protein ArsB [Bacillota bacterium]
MHALIASMVFVATLTLVILRPKGVNEAYYALGGAVVAMLAGLISWQDVVVVAGIVWNATLALIAIMVISQVLDEAGFFRWIALHLARMAGRSGMKLFLGLNAMAALVTIFFNNDGSILIVTPIAYELLSALGLGSSAVLPFLFATGFMADAASVPLAVSNLTNIVTSDLFGLSFVGYARLLMWPGLITILAAMVVLTLQARRKVDLILDVKDVGEPASAIRDPFVFKIGAMVMVGVIAGYMIGEVYAIPASLIASAGGIILLAATQRHGIISARAVVKRAPWLIVLFAMGMYLVVYALRNVGLTAWLGQLVMAALAQGEQFGLRATGGLFAVVSSVMNNLPSVMTGDLTITALPTAETTKRLLAAANVIGCDIGPKLTPIGSLATLLWMHILKGKGISVGWGEYLKFGLLVTPPVLVVALLTI